MNLKESYISCCLCPRHCQVNRLHGQKGFCGETAQLRVASLGAHFGEEPPISGIHGSGTVFFSGCTLQCEYCQNYQISCQHLGATTTIEEVGRRLTELYAARQIHNINFVTPDHFFPHTCAIVAYVRRQSIDIPAVYNVSGYQDVHALRTLEPTAAIYLPDFKYADNRLGEQLSHCHHYVSTALDALTEMIRQKGFLDSTLNDDSAAIARQGVLVRHLILPGQVQNSLDALSMLLLEFGRRLPLSLMAQYHPISVSGKSELKQLPDMQRPITREEFQQVYDCALELGFEHLFVQYPEQQDTAFLPDFQQDEPFQGNVGRG
ncbi:MAG: 4Fe-4S cluster-binding domain-containing protein [Candidatus Vecturithrix sp.]|jgi:putative pyruvate formate lyase activating enzyme|nr:4Fe-4S cluster-binding domain-containing protein [Candidatus Vecturithrix sp.]